MTGDQRPETGAGSSGPPRPSVAPEAWDDERLAAAFAGRYDRPAPHDLTIATLDRVAQIRRRPRWWPRFDRPTRDRLVAVVGVVAVVAVVGVVAQPWTSSRPGTTATGPAGSRTSPTSSPASSNPYVEPSPAVAGFPTDVGGLTVRSITDATRLLAEPTLGDTELAIAGWYSASDLALPCPDQPAPASPVEIRCPDVHAWLSATDRPIMSADGSLEQAVDPATLLPLRFVAPSEPLGGDGGPHHAMNTTPQQVVAIGHFHDERSSGCPADERATCEQTFVVDVLSSGYGTWFDRPTSVVEPAPTTRLSGAAALGLARDRLGPYATVLQVGLELGSDPPWFRAKTAADCLCPPTWFVRGFRYLADGTTDPRPAGTPVASWLVIDDATGTISGPLAESIPPPATPYPFASPPDGFPTTIEGLPVRTVADVVDPGRVDRERDQPIAVAGWFTQLPLHPCEATADCNRETVVLAGTDKRLVTTAPGGVATLVPPDGPVLNPAILPGGASRPAVPMGTPLPAIFIVHAGDPRADRDGPGNPVGSETFVLDQVAWLNGKAQGPTEWIAPGLDPVESPTKILHDTAGGVLTAPDTWPISISAVLARDMATLGVNADQDIAPDKVVWVVRLAGRMPREGGPPGPDGYGEVLVVSDEILSTHWTSP